jgi:hypothetical protein
MSDMTRAPVVRLGDGAVRGTVEPGWAPYDTVRRTTGLLTKTVLSVDDPAGDERVLWDGIR